MAVEAVVGMERAVWESIAIMQIMGLEDFRM